MTAKEQLLREIQHSPEPLIKEVLDFLLFAKSRNYPHSAEAKTISQHQKLTLNALISTIPNNFTYPDDVTDFIESEPLRRELL
jgi:hypothetical protein